MRRSIFTFITSFISIGLFSQATETWSKNSEINDIEDFVTELELQFQAMPTDILNSEYVAAERQLRDLSRISLEFEDIVTWLAYQQSLDIESLNLPTFLEGAEGDWYELGPYEPIEPWTNSSNAGGALGVGPVNFISFTDNYLNSGLAFCGSWNGGLFYSNDFCQSWHSAMDYLFIDPSASDCITHHSLDDIWFASTGNGDGLFIDNGAQSMTARSTGVYRNIGGTEAINWEEIASDETFGYENTNVFQIKEILADPHAPMPQPVDYTLFVTCSGGLWKTTNALASAELVEWEHVLAFDDAALDMSNLGNLGYDLSEYSITDFWAHDIDFRADTDYPCVDCDHLVLNGTVFLTLNPLLQIPTQPYWNKLYVPVILTSERSPDQSIGESGTWQIIDGLPLSLLIDDRMVRTSTEFSPANPDLIYVKSSPHKFQANDWNNDNTIDNADAAFHKMDFRVHTYSVGSNSWSNKALSLSSQSWVGYSSAPTAFAVSPVDQDQLYSCYRYEGATSFDQGNTGGWTKWQDEMHDDIEDVVIGPDGNVYWITHGGIYVTDLSGNSLGQRNNGLGVAEFYGFANGEYDHESIAVGAYHCGSKISYGHVEQGWTPGWRQINYGDGQWTAIADDNSDYVISSAQYGGNWEMATQGYSAQSVGILNGDIPGVEHWDAHSGINEFNNEYVYGVSRDGFFRHIGHSSYSSLTWEDFGVVGSQEDLDLQPMSSAFKVWPSKAHRDVVFGFGLHDQSVGTSGVGNIYINNKATAPIDQADGAWHLLEIPDEFCFGNNYVGWIAKVASDPLNMNVMYSNTSLPVQSSPLIIRYSCPDILASELDFIVEDITFDLPRHPIRDIEVIAGTGLILVATDVGVFATTESIIADFESGNVDEVWFRYGRIPFVSTKILDYSIHGNMLRAGTFGRGGWEIPLPCNKIEDPYIVNSLETWDVRTRWQQDVIVENGAVLRISHEAFFAPDCGIKVHVGGRLELLDGAHLTSACDELWTGIEVWGNDFEPQTIVTQGYLQASGATIENAHAGVWVRQNNENCEAITASGGGIVKCNSCDFINCYVGVIFQDYIYTNTQGNKVKNLSYFKNCKFETSDILLGGFYPKSGIILDHNYGIDVLGCDFVNTAVNNPDLAFHYNEVEHRGIGIISNGSNFKVAKRCSQYNGFECVEFDYGTFTDLHEGIRALGSDGLYPFEVSEITFEGNNIGLRMEQLETAEVYLNEFILRDQPENLGFLVNAGVYIEEMDNFQIQENQFHLANVANPNAVYVGIVVTNTLEFEKEIYHNFFDELTQGFHIQGNNGDYDDNEIASGLQIRCNDFGQNDGPNTYDVRIRAPYWNGATTNQSTISPQQGSLQDLGPPAGNRFSHVCVEEDADFRISLANTSQASSISYYSTSDGASVLIPDCFTDEKIASFEQTNSYDAQTCPQLVTPESIDIIQVPGGIWSQGIGPGIVESELVKAAYLDELDRGDVNGLVTFIDDPGHSSAEIRNEMLSCVPLISMASWKSAFMKQPEMNPWHLAQVLLASSPLSQPIIDMMYTYDLDTYYRTLVLDGQNGGISENGVYQNEYSSIAAEIYRNKAEYIQTTLDPNFSDASDSQEIISRLEANPDFDDELLAALYIQDNREQDALDLLGNCLNSDGTTDYECLVLSYLAESQESGRNCPRFTESQKTQLELIANNGEPGYTAARAALMAEYEEYSDYWPAIIDIDWLNRSATVETSESIKSGNPFFEVHPNPSSGRGFFVFKIPEGSTGDLEVYDELGRLKYSRQIQSSVSVIEVDCGVWGSGLYVCKLNIDGIKVASEKWIIQH